MSNELSAQDFLPPEIGLTLLGFEKSAQGWLVRAEGRTPLECPSCGTESTARVQRIHLSTRRRPTPVARTMALALRPLTCNARTLANSSFLAFHRSATSCLLWVCTSGFARERESGTGTVFI